MKNSFVLFRLYSLYYIPR